MHKVFQSQNVHPSIVHNLKLKHTLVKGILINFINGLAYLLRVIQSSFPVLFIKVASSRKSPKGRSAPLGRLSFKPQ